MDLPEKEKERDWGARLRKGEQHNIKSAIWPVGYKTSQQPRLCRPQSEYTAQHAGTFCFNLPLTSLQPCFSKSGLNEPQGRMPHKQTNMRRCITRNWHSSMAPQGGWGAHSLLFVAWHRQKQEERVGRQEKKTHKKWGGKDDSVCERAFIYEEQKRSCGVSPFAYGDPSFSNCGSAISLYFLQSMIHMPCFPFRIRTAYYCL